MSDIEDDIDDQLLELAGATEKKTKRQHSSGSAGGGNSSGSKKRKAERMDIDSDRDPVESEEEMEDPYPLEGKYKDDTDKRDLLSMTEIRREQILEERAGERQRLQNARQIADLVRQQRSGTANNDENVSRAAKRQHTARGATKEKASKLDELKARRKAKDDKKRSKANGSPQRERSSSPQDMDISDSESEDGQISKQELEDERLLGLGGYKKWSAKEEVDDTPCTMVDLETGRLTRGLIVKHSAKPWFEDYVKGAWVRYLIGHEPEGGPVYRICQISNLAADLVKPYKVDGKMINQAFELKHGKSTKLFNMDKVSNGPFLEKEFERLLKVCSAEGVDMPTKQDMEKKVGEMRKLIDQPMTENDISMMLARKSQLQTINREGLTMLERSRLMQERTLALRRQDYAEVTEIDVKLEEASKTLSPPMKQHDSATDLLAKVNERNRKANVEAVRRAELAETERKRRERKLATRNGGTPTPSDPSARLKTLPKTFNATTRSGTPATGSPAPELTGAQTMAVKAGSSFEDSLINSVEIDLGDF